MGVAFKNVITAAPWTNPSLASLFTGVCSHKMDLYKYRASFPNDVKLVQEYFADKGFTVASYFATKNLFSGERTFEHGTTREIPPILQWLEANKNCPFFLFLHYWQTHPPYFRRYSKEGWYDGRDSIVKLLQEKEERGSRQVEELYRHSIERFSEEFVYAIVERLDRLNILKDTHVLITADHGESFGNRVKNREEELDIFAMHGKFLYQEILKVPLICMGPGVPVGQEITTQVRSIDIAPTLLELHGIEKDSSFREMDGRSLVRVWKDEERKDRLALVSTTYAFCPSVNERNQAYSFFAALDGRWKVIYDKQTNKWTGYDLVQDARENDLLDVEEHSALKVLQQELAKEIERFCVSDDEARHMERQLQSLGYL
jgi:arylsulfatase A-like enzyme